MSLCEFENKSLHLFAFLLIYKNYVIFSISKILKTNQRTEHKKEEAEDSDRLCKIHDLCERKASVTHQMKIVVIGKCPTMSALE